MVTHGGRCPFCQQRTTPGVGTLAGLWICAPCKSVFDNYGHLHQQAADRPLTVNNRRSGPSFLPQLAAVPVRDRRWTLPLTTRACPEV